MEKKRIRFYRGEEDSEILLNWWKGLETTHGERARLRRATSVSQVFFCPAFYWLISNLGKAGYDVNARRLAIVAGVASHVQNNISAESMGKYLAGFENDKPLISESRFRRLLAIPTRDELYLPLVRLVAALKESLPVVDLAHAGYCWGDRIKKCWAEDYYRTLISKGDNT